MSTPEERAAARDFAVQHLNLDPAPLRDAIDATYRDVWTTWTAGDAGVAGQLADGGLATLLDNAGLIIDGILDTTLEGLGNILADGAAQGLGPAAIGRLLDDYLDDPVRAYTIADTELARAVAAASDAQYADAGVREVDLLVSPGACVICIDTAQGNPHPIGQLVVPLHPRCRCATAPVDPGQPQDTTEGDTGG